MMLGWRRPRWNEISSVMLHLPCGRDQYRKALPSGGTFSSPTGCKLEGAIQSIVYSNGYLKSRFLRGSKPMITESDFYQLAKANPTMMRAFYEAVNAIIDYRNEAEASQGGLWAKMRLKKKQFDATFLVKQFARGLVFNGQPASEEEKRQVERWIIEAANFHMLPKEEQRRQLATNTTALLDALRENNTKSETHSPDAQEGSYSPCSQFDVILCSDDPEKQPKEIALVVNQKARSAIDDTARAIPWKKMSDFSEEGEIRTIHIPSLPPRLQPFAVEQAPDGWFSASRLIAPDERLNSSLGRLCGIFWSKGCRVGVSFGGGAVLPLDAPA
jgi:hypothetical protein